MIPTYAKGGSQAFNTNLHETLSRLASEVQGAMGETLVALVLGGGYGRGEGGVLVVDGKEHPYNDLDFTLIVRRKAGVPWELLREISRNYGHSLGIHVDFSRPLTLGDVRSWPRWLMWYDLLNGHMVLLGPPDVIEKNAPSRLREPLPLIEATRLLLNRGAGLLWALRVVRKVEEAPDRDFVRRNYYKCALALGDALLIAYRRFASPYLGRDRRLRQIEEEHPAVKAFGLDTLYGDALRFKFRPADCPTHGFGETRLTETATLWGAVFLHVERLRTGGVWADMDTYVAWRGIRERDQHTLGKLLRNLVRNRQMGTGFWRYPREALYRELPRLLGLTAEPCRNWEEAGGRFLKIWDRFN